MRRWLSALAFVIALLFAVRGLAAWHGRRAGPLYDGQLEAQRELARGVDRWIAEDLGRGDFATGDARYDGEWLFVTYMMAVLGHAQLAVEHPELRAFDREAWGADPIDDLGSERAHLAYLGYLSLALSLARFVDPETRFAELEARVIEHLAARFEASTIGLVETYPGEIYPTDNSTFTGALAVHDRATGDDHRALLAHLIEGMGRARDPRSGLLFQAMASDGSPRDLARGSGTALAAYFVSFADGALSRSLFSAIERELARSFLGFGTTREFLPGEGGFGDVDSGPVLFGQGPSASGFSIALARIHREPERFTALLATASFVGGPIDADGTHYALGGPLGDALLFALSTALPAERWSAP